MKKVKNISDFMDYLLKEDVYVPQPKSSFDIRPQEQDVPVSLDQVVDRYIIRYEKEAIPTVEDYENEMLEGKIQNYSDVLIEALNEAENETQAQALSNKEADIASSFGASTNVGGDITQKEKSTEERAIINTPQINLDQFAKSVARLVNNFEVLLNPKDIVLNRVENYIKINYDTRAAAELMQILDANYSLRTQEKNLEKKDNTPETYAVGALSNEGWYAHNST